MTIISREKKILLNIHELTRYHKKPNHVANFSSLKTETRMEGWFNFEEVSAHLEL